MLTPEQRTALRHRLQRELSRRGVDIGVTKAQAMSALDALDAKLDELEAELNLALPQPARGTWSTQLKAYILAELVMERYVRGGG